MAAAAGAHTLAVTEAGELWSWGCGSLGRLGHNDARSRLRPERVAVEHFVGGGRIAAVSCASFHSAIVTEDGALYTFGRAASYPGMRMSVGEYSRSLSQGSFLFDRLAGTDWSRPQRPPRQTRSYPSDPLPGSAGGAMPSPPAAPCPRLCDGHAPAAGPGLHVWCATGARVYVCGGVPR